MICNQSANLLPHNPYILRDIKLETTFQFKANNELCIGKLTKAWGLGGLVSAHSKEP